MQKFFRENIFLSKCNFTLAERLKTLFGNYNVELEYISKFSCLIKYILKEKPCLIFIDKGDICDAEVLSDLAENCEKFKYFCYIFINNDISIYEKYVNNKNIFAIKETDIRASVIKSFYTHLAYNIENNSTDLSLFVAMQLQKYGFTTKLSGFNMIKMAILELAKNNYICKNLQNKVYCSVAKAFNVRPSNVERNIRTSITHALKESDELRQFLRKSKETISNREFISLLCEMTRQEFCFMIA